MRDAFLHFVASAAGALVLFLLFTKLSGAKRFSAPFGVVFVGVACAGLAHFLSPWATPAILALYAVAGVCELRRDRGTARRAQSGERQR